MPYWKLTPSGLTFGLRCPACFHATMHGWRKPYEPFPSVFGKIDRIQREYWAGRSISEMCSTLGFGPLGTINTTELTVTSREMRITPNQSSFYFNGKIDGHAVLSDGTLLLLDFKTSSLDKIRSEHADLYKRQLHAMAWAIENPSDKTQKKFPCGIKISRMGLMVYEPSHLEGSNMVFRREWVPIQRDDIWFSNFLSGVIDLLDQPVCLPDPNCDWCKIRSQSGGIFPPAQPLSLSQPIG